MTTASPPPPPPHIGRCDPQGTALLTLPAADFLVAASFTPADFHVAAPRWVRSVNRPRRGERGGLVACARLWLSTLRALATLNREWSDAAAPCLHAVFLRLGANLHSCVHCARPCYRGGRWCRGCMRECYCGAACQHDAWNAGHRQACYNRRSQGAAVTIQRAWRLVFYVPEVD